MKERGVFLCPLRHYLNLFPLLCRKSLPLSQQLRQESGKFFGISQKSPYLCISYLNLTFVHFCINLFWLLVSNVAYGVRRDASPFAISTPIKNMGYPCHFSISNPCRLMEDGGCPPKVRVRMSRYFVGDTFRWSSLIISQASRLWASFPIYSTKEKDVTAYSVENYAHSGIQWDLFYPPSLRFRASFSIRLQRYTN